MNKKGINAKAIAISGLNAPHGPIPPLISYQITLTTPKGPAPSTSSSTTSTTAHLCARSSVSDSRWASTWSPRESTRCRSCVSCASSAVPRPRGTSSLSHHLPRRCAPPSAGTETISALGGTALPGPTADNDAAAPSEARSAMTASPSGVHTGSAHSAGVSDKR